jgi:polyisoprenoid-binding protein YceI
MNTINHENKSLVKHLKDEDFFYVKKYPVAEFQLSTVKNGKASGFVIIRNIKKPIEFPVSIVENAAKQLVIKGTLSIDRTQFEIYYNSNSFFQNLGNNAIKNQFDLKFELVVAAGS